jgi:transcriptional regulator with XRE-family HTH domain
VLRQESRKVEVACQNTKDSLVYQLSKTLQNAPHLLGNGVAKLRNESPLPTQLKKARQALGITQQELGIRLGLDAGNASARMNQYETGKHTPDYTMLKQLAAELNVPVPYLLCEDPLLGDLILELSKLTEAEKVKMLNTLKAAAKQ